MRTNEVQKMHAHVFRGRHETFSTHLRFRRSSLLPQRIDQLESDGNVADQFTELVVAHNESGFGELVFPEFTGVVKKNARDQKIKVQLQDRAARSPWLCASFARCARPVRRAGRDDICALRRCDEIGRPIR